MSFHSPIDEKQWKEAKYTYQTMRSNLRLLRRMHSPRTPDEAEILGKYKAAIQEFGRELLKPYGKISGDKLNELDGRCVGLFVVYSTVHNFGERGK